MSRNSDLYLHALVFALALVGAMKGATAIRTGLFELDFFGEWSIDGRHARSLGWLLVLLSLVAFGWLGQTLLTAIVRIAPAVG